jgi:predicted nuclease of restriction endonuclease-like RecB superfamily
VPDLAFVHRETGEVIYLEVLGFWSRDAVWKRVELAKAGLREKIVFAVSSRLRVSEEVLDDDSPAALYVYKGAIVPRDIEAKLEVLRMR